MEKDFLSKLELKAIEEKYFSIERLAIVKDIFVFCCYTGLAYVDVMKLDENHIIKGIDGEDWIKITHQKTNILVNIPLLPAAMVVLTNYLNHHRSIKFDNISPVFSNPKNQQLPERDSRLVWNKKEFNVPCSPPYICHNSNFIEWCSD